MTRQSLPATYGVTVMFADRVDDITTAVAEAESLNGEMQFPAGRRMSITFHRQCIDAETALTYGLRESVALSQRYGGPGEWMTVEIWNTAAYEPMPTQT